MVPVQTKGSLSPRDQRVTKSTYVRHRWRTGRDSSREACQHAGSTRCNCVRRGLTLEEKRSNEPVIVTVLEVTHPPNGYDGNTVYLDIKTKGTVA